MKEIPILHKRITGMAAHRGKLSVGILGTHKGCGVTHLGILLANYFSMYAGCRTAFLECHPQHDMQSLQSYVYGDPPPDNGGSFKVCRVSYYGNIKEQAIAEVVGDNYDCVILDFGTDLSRCKNEFLRCDKRIVVSSLAPWRIYELERFIVSTGHIKFSGQWIYAVPFAKSREIKRTAQDLGREICAIPYESDPFDLSGESARTLRQLIKIPVGRR